MQTIPITRLLLKQSMCTMAQEAVQLSKLDPKQFAYLLKAGRAQDFTIEEMLQKVQTFPGFDELGEYQLINKSLWNFHQIGLIESREMLHEIANMYHDRDQTVIHSIWLMELMKAKQRQLWTSHYWNLQSSWMLHIRNMNIDRLRSISQFMSICKHYQHNLLVNSIAKQLQNFEHSRTKLDILLSLNPSSDEQFAHLNEERKGILQKIQGQYLPCELWPYMLPEEIKAQIGQMGQLSTEEQLNTLQQALINMPLKIDPTIAQLLEKATQNMKGSFLNSLLSVSNLSETDLFVWAQEQPKLDLDQLVLLAKIRNPNKSVLESIIVSKVQLRPQLKHFSELSAAIRLYNEGTYHVKSALHRTLGRYHFLVADV